MISIIFILAMICLFTLVGCALHALSSRASHVPLLFYVAGMTGILDLNELAPIIIEPYDNFVLVISADIFIPVILAVFLVVYVANGTRLAQLMVYGSIAVAVASLGLIAAMAVALHYFESAAVGGALVEDDVITPDLVRRIIVGRIAFVVDMFAIAVIFQGAYNRLPNLPRWVLPGIALLGAFWTDAIIYNLLAESGTADFFDLFPSDVLMKTLAALTLWPLVSTYIARFAFASVDPRKTLERPTLDMFTEPLRGMRTLLAQTRQELLSSRSMLETVVDNIDEIFWLAQLGDDNQIEYISPSFERVLQINRAEVMRNPRVLMELVHPDDRGRFANGLARYLLQNRTDEFRIVMPDGTTKWLRSRIFTLPDDIDPSRRRLGGLVEDVTERKAADERTFALALERERVNLLQSFIRDTSHDLRTPISAILMRAHLLRKVEDGPTRERYLQDLIDRSEYLTRLIDNLFALSRIESSAPETVQRINLNQILRGVMQSVQPKVEDKQLELRSDLATDLPETFANPYDVERAVSNLVENAIRYTEEGHITIRSAQLDGHIEVSVADTGIGIEADELHRLYDRFFRARTAIGKRVQGTGLGLSIVKSVLERYGGSINVTSEVGVGTTFTLRMPTADAFAAPSPLTTE